MQTNPISTGQAAWRVRLLALLAVAILAFPVWAANGPAVTVMTRNLWAGADLDAVFGATDEASFVAATTKLMAQLKASGAAERVAAVADEIQAAKPDLVALQEVVLWRTGPIMKPPASAPLYDLLDLLMKELEKRDLHYAPVASQILTDAEAPIPTEGVDLRYTDRDVVLARIDKPQAEFDVYNPQARRYETQLSFGGPLVGDVKVYRGWIAMDVVAKGRHFYFVATHLEATIPGVPQAEASQVAQGKELVALLGKLEGTAVVAGDFNSNAEPGPEHTGVAQSIVQAGFADSWKMTHFGEPGYTWPVFEGNSQTGVATPNERIDLVFVRGIRPTLFNRDAGVVSAEICGASKASSGRWASDHAGLVVKLQFD